MKEKTMTKSETSALLTAEDIAKITNERTGYGCLWITAIPGVLTVTFFLFFVDWSYDPTSSALTVFATIGISLLILIPMYKFFKKRDGKIDKDVIGGQKKIIIAPIVNKRIKSSDITSGRNKGGIESKYFMTIAGRDYLMTEHTYLTIPVGEFMGIHLAPHSKTVLREKWLKKDGNVEEEIEEEI